MELEGTVTGGLLVLDDGATLPEGTRFRALPIPFGSPVSEPEPVAGWFMRDFGQFCRVINDPESPTDLASQHEHYRLGTPKR
jgi:hypothetical protein